MSELLLLAAALRGSQDAAIRQALVTRRSTATSAKDFFDLADSFISSKSVVKALAALPRSLASALETLASGEAIADEHLAELECRYLAHSADGTASVFESVSGCLVQLRKGSTLGLLEPGEQTEPVLPNSELAQTVFTALQSMTELLYDFEYRFVREIGKSGISLADIKRLAGHLRQSNDFTREIFEVAQIGGLVWLRNGRWQPTLLAQKWLELSFSERWVHLAEALNAQLEGASRAELTNLRALGFTSMVQMFATAFPFADAAVNSLSAKFQATAFHLGLASNGSVTTWFDQVLAGQVETAAVELSRLLPSAQDRIICQADLTLIAPGPLASAIEKKLRSFVDIEQVGMASSYRINALSISHGLETGLTEREITDLLTNLSGRELPQPLAYLIRDVAQKFGQLRVTQSLTEHNCTISSADEILLKQLENDSRLRHLSLKRNPAGLLQSRMDAEIVYSSMRSVGYTIVRSLADGKIISPRLEITPDSELAADDSIDAMLKLIRERDALAEPEGDDLLRQIQLALKNKSELEVVVKTNSGDEVTFILEPIGLANNRLRARDRKADIERTLPLDKILRVTLAV